MTKFVTAAALAALSVAIPAAAPAQKVNPATIVVIDTDRVFRDCNACKAAQTQLQQQMTQLQQRAQQLGQPLQTEAQSLDAAVKALAGKQPDAALQQRATAFQQKQTAAQQELAKSEQTLGRNRQFVVQQIQAKLGPIYQQVMTARGANMAVDSNVTLAAVAGIDVTNDVLAQLNQQLPSVSVTAPPAPAQPQQPQPQGR